MKRPKSIRGLEVKTATWDEVAARQNADSVIVIPLGAEAKEHGHHLPLNNDFIMAEYFKDRLLEEIDIIAYPTINYFYFPAFIDYAGSTNVEQDTSVKFLCDIVRSIARNGPKKFYILNTGISTLRPLKTAQELLAPEGITLRYSNLSNFKSEVALTQEGGSHADEGETSLMLAIAPQIVNLKKASKDFHEGTGRLSPKKAPDTTYSPTGTWGDPTLATLAKGRQIEKAYLQGLLREVRELIER